MRYDAGNSGPGLTQTHKYNNSEMYIQMYLWYQKVEM